METAEGAGAAGEWGRLQQPASPASKALVTSSNSAGSVFSVGQLVVVHASLRRKQRRRQIMIHKLHVQQLEMLPGQHHAPLLKRLSTLQELEEDDESFRRASVSILMDLCSISMQLPRLRTKFRAAALVALATAAAAAAATPPAAAGVSSTAPAIAAADEPQHSQLVAKSTSGRRSSHSTATTTQVHHGSGGGHPPTSSSGRNQHGGSGKAQRRAAAALFSRLSVRIELRRHVRQPSQVLPRRVWWPATLCLVPTGLLSSKGRPVLNMFVDELPGRADGAAPPPLPRAELRRKVCVVNDRHHSLALVDASRGFAKLRWRIAASEARPGRVDESQLHAFLERAAVAADQDSAGELMSAAHAVRDDAGELLGLSADGNEQVIESLVRLWA